MPPLFQSVLSAIRSALPGELNSQHALHEPLLAGNEWKYVRDCLDSGWVSPNGSYVARFERDLVAFTGAGHAVATVTGTAALHACLLLVGVGQNDEVLVPTLTFVATANAVAYCGATPHFADIDETTLGVSPRKLADYLESQTQMRGPDCVNLRTGKRIRALIVMHAFGFPAELDNLQDICAHHHIILIEDAAESIGSLYKGQHTGTWGRVSCLSFNGNKTITTGGGGAILTSEEDLAKRARHLTTTAKLPHPWAFFHDQVGFDYRLPNINAALGCAQLEQLPDFLERKRELALRYQKAFSGMLGARIMKEPTDSRSNYWLNVLVLDREYADDRDRLLTYLHEHGILARPAWRLLHRLPMYEEAPKMDLSIAEDLEPRIVNLPSSASLGITGAK